MRLGSGSAVCPSRPSVSCVSSAMMGDSKEERKSRKDGDGVRGRDCCLRACGATRRQPGDRRSLLGSVDDDDFKSVVGTTADAVFIRRSSHCTSWTTLPSLLLCLPDCPALYSTLAGRNKVMKRLLHSTVPSAASYPSHFVLLRSRIRTYLKAN